MTRGPVKWVAVTSLNIVTVLPAMLALGILCGHTSSSIGFRLWENAKSVKAWLNSL